MAQRIGFRSLRSLDPVRCLPPTLPSKCFVWCCGLEFVAQDLHKWRADTGAKTMYIKHSSPWENGYCESFNSKRRDEFLNGEIF